MDSETSTRNDVDLLERVLLDGNAEPMHVPLSLLESITNSFSEDHQIGSGGFAVVYKGIVGKGMVAVKKLSTFSLPEDKFNGEVECLTKARHKNVVRFVGYCSDTQKRIAYVAEKFVMADIRNWLLCFEYVPNGSLDKYITDASRGLEWKERYGVIKGICEGLLHLHERHILHLDLKPGNILVDDHMVPKITDFGLSKCLDKEQSRAIITKIYGSRGYFAPEYCNGEVAFTSDIYSLGVIILEILTGKKGYPEDEKVIDNWRSRLEGSDHWDVQLEQVRVCMKIGIECMDLDPKKRPVARHIIDRLDGTISSVKTSISSSSVEQQVSFLKEQNSDEKTTKLASEYPGKDNEEQAETEELMGYVVNPREDHWQQGQEEALGDQWSLWGAEYTRQNAPEDASISGSNSGVLYKFSNLNIFNTKARRNYVRNGGPVLEKIKSVKLFKKEKLDLKEHNLIREGCSGKLYVGFVDRVPVVIRKQIRVTMRESGRFANEVISQSKILHKNIVRFIGCCVEVEIPMLVYEFLPKGSLHDILHGNNKVHLDLAMRLSIAAQVAGGLAYMHSVASIHGNVKSTNVLFDHNYVPKISKSVMSSTMETVYEVRVDHTYRDPVYLQTGVLTEKSDVYSFGVVILELLTRKKATLVGNNSITNFLESQERGRKLTELFDKEIAVAKDLVLLDNIAVLVVECLNHDLDLRPTMMDIQERLLVLTRSIKL